MTSKDKFVFFGSTKFAAIILEKLIAAGFMPTVVVVNPDRPFGRKRVIAPPPVKSFINNVGLNLKILQPEKLDDELEFEMKRLEPSFGIVAYYAKIIPKKFVDIFLKGLIGVHPSLLPRYRGPSPIQSAILNGEKETGSTIYVLDEKTDHGPTLSMLKCEIADNETNEELSKKLAELGGDLLVMTLPNFMAGQIKPFPQDESGATYTSKFASEDAFVEPALLKMARSEGGAAAVEIDRKIRALNPEPGVWTLQWFDETHHKQAQGKPKRIKLLTAAIETGKLVLKKIQTEGEKPRIIS